MTLPHDATGLSAVYDCGISDHTHLLILKKNISNYKISELNKYYKQE